VKFDDSKVESFIAAERDWNILPVVWPWELESQIWDEM